MKSSTIPPTYRRRLAELGRAIAAAGVDGLLVSYTPDQFYLTGAVLEDSAVLVAGTGSRCQAVIVTDSRFDEQTAIQAPWAEKLLRTDSLSDAVLAAAADLRIARLGLDEHLSLGQFEQLNQCISRGPKTPGQKPHGQQSVGVRKKRFKIQVKITRRLVSAGRAIKDDGEVATIVRAIRAAEAGYLATVRAVKPGVRENDIAAELEYQMRLAGAAGSSFEPIVAAGRRASLPHARASGVKVRPGQPVLFDWGARVGGYCSDLTRVLAVGGGTGFQPVGGTGRKLALPKAIREIYPIVADAQLAGIAAIRPGAACRDVDAAARRIIEQAGYGPQFGHGLGHGLGLDVHEGPRLGAKSDDVLAAGMVVTVEPGIYLPGVGGVRIEDDVLVTAGGGRVLSKLPKRLF